MDKLPWMRKDKDRLKKREQINLSSESILDSSPVFQEQLSPTSTAPQPFIRGAGGGGVGTQPISLSGSAIPTRSVRASVNIGTHAELNDNYNFNNKFNISNNIININTYNNNGPTPHSYRAPLPATPTITTSSPSSTSSPASPLSLSSATTISFIPSSSSSSSASSLSSGPGQPKPQPQHLGTAGSASSAVVTSPRKELPPKPLPRIKSMSPRFMTEKSSLTHSDPSFHTQLRNTNNTNNNNNNYGDNNTNNTTNTGLGHKPNIAPTPQLSLVSPPSFHFENNNNNTNTNNNTNNINTTTNNNHPLSSSMPSTSTGSISGSSSSSSPSSSVNTISLSSSTSTSGVVGQVGSGGTSLSGSFSVVGESVDADADYMAADERVQQLKNMLKKLSNALKKYNTEGLKHGKTLTSFAENLEKMSFTERRSNVDSVYAEALSKFAQLEREVSAKHCHFHQQATETFLTQIHEFMEKDITQELKALRGKYEKARKDYDSAVGKVTALRQKAKPDIIKLFNAEKELKRLKKIYEDSLEEALLKIDEIELKKQCNFLEWLITLFQCQRDVFGEDYAMLVHIDNYLKELLTWSAEWRQIFLENTRKRASEQAQLIQEEKENMCMPLLQLTSNTTLTRIMQDVARQEGQSMPALDTVSKHNYAQLHSFLRTYYDPISQALLLSGHQDLLKELTSALAILEKGRKSID